MDVGSRSFSARAIVLLVLAIAAVAFGATGTASAAPITMIGGPPSTITQEATGPVTTVNYDHPTATANGLPIAVNCAPASGSQYPLGFSYGGTCVAVDEGDMEIVTFIVEIVDTTPPTFTPVSYIGPFEATSPSGAAPNWPLPTANDLVDVDVEVTCSPAPGEYLPLGFSTVDCTAEDDSGNSTSTSFVAVVDDNTPPVFEPLSNIGPIEISDPAGEVVTWPDPVANDSVDTSVDVSCSPTSGSTFSLGTQSVNCTATDDSGNNAYTWFEVEVVDTVGPVFSNIPNPGTFEAEDQFGAYVDFDLPTAYDDGTGDVYVNCDNPPGTYSIGQYTVNCQATDSRSNTSFTSFSFEVEDSTAPSFVGVPTSPVVVQSLSSAGATVDFDFLSVTDAVDQYVDLNCSPPSGTFFALGTTQVNCQASDDSGNNSQATFDVQVQLIDDDTPPMLSGVPADFEALATGPSGATVNFTAPTATDAVYGSVPVNCTPSSGSTFPIGTTNVSCSAQDGSGNSVSASFNVTVFEPADVTPQIVAGGGHTCTLSSVGLVECFGSNYVGQLGFDGSSTTTATPVLLGGTAAQIAAGTYHTCALMSSGEVKCFGGNNYGQLGVGPASGDPNPDPVTVDLGSDVVVSIAAGGDVACAVLDTGVIKCWGRNQYGQLGNPTNSGTTVPNLQPSTVDLAAPATEVSISQSHACALLESGNVACWGRNQIGELLTDTNFGSLTINLPAIVDFDGEAVEVGAGAGATCVRLESGEVRCGGRSNFGQLGTADAYTAGSPVTLDVPGPVTQIGMGELHGCFLLANASVYCAGSNGTGQLGSSINLGGNTAGQAAQLADFGGEVFQVAAGTAHTCALLTDGTVRCAGWNYNGQLGNPANAFDSQANPTALSTSQYLGDPVGPVISGVPDDIVAEATGPSGAAVNFTPPTAEDGVDGSVPVDCSPSSGSTFALGETTVTCSAEDAAGHETTATFTVTVEDETAPAITDVPGTITEEATSAAGAVVTYTDPTALDLVDGSVIVECSPASGSTFPITTTTVDCEATDAADNTGTASFDVTVEDTTKPVFDSYPSSQMIDATGVTSALGYALPTATDTVDNDVVVSCNPGPTATFTIPTNESVTCTATDDASNEETLTFSVQLDDYSDPELSDLPTDQTVEATSASGAVVNYSLPTSLDVVDGALPVDCSPAPGSTFAIGQTLVLCQSEDNSNNTAEHEFWITVEDTTGPEILDPPDDIAVEATGPLGANAPLPILAAEDLVDGSSSPDCSGVTPPYPIGTTTINCVAEDTRGNETLFSFDINVVDTTAPTITGVPADISIPSTSGSGAAVTYPLPTASDIVDGNVPVICSPAPGSAFAVGTSTVTCTATDTHGQSASSSFKVVVDPQVIDLSETFRIVSAKFKRKNRLVVTVDVPAAGQLEVIATNRRPRSGAVASVLKPGPGRDKEGRAVLDLEKSGRYAATLRIDRRKAGLVKGKRNPLLRVTARFKLPTGEVKHRVVFVRLK